MKARLYEKYTNEVVPALKEKHKYANVHQIPKMEKIVVNMGVSASLEKGAIDDAAKDLSQITGASRLSASRAKALPISNCARASRLVAGLPCDATRCMNSSTGWSL